MTSKQFKDKNTNGKDKLNFGKRLVTVIIIVTILVFQTTSVGMLPGDFVTPKSGIINLDFAIAAPSLAEVNLLESVEVTAELGNLEGDEPYHLLLSLSGTGLADAELASPERVAIFYAPDLAGELIVANSANTRVEILPVTMESLPALDTAVGGLTGTATSLIGELLDALDVILNDNPLLKPFVSINGLTEVNTAIDNLKNLDQALADLLAYEDQIDVTVNSNGSIIINFGDGLGNHLDATINELVTGLVNDLLAAVGGLEIEVLPGVRDIPIVGPVLDGIVNDLILGGIVNELLEGLTAGLEPAVTELTSALTNVTDELAGVQVIGETTIDLNITIDKKAVVSGEVPIYGTAVNDSTIDVSLLADLEDFDMVYFPDIIAPEAPIVEDVYSTDKTIKGTSEPESEITITFPDNTAATGTTDLEGNFDVPILEGIVLEGGGVLVITATDEAGNTSDPTTIEVIEAKVSISVPENLLFETTMIDSKPTTILRQEPNWSIEVVDTRREGSRWRLIAQVDQPLTLDSNQDDSHTLPNALVYIDEDNYSTPMEDGPIEVFSGEKKIRGEETTSLNWGANQGPLVQLVPADAYVGAYKTTITWTLIEAP